MNPEELVNELTPPIYVYRMAFGIAAGPLDTPMRRSAVKRRDNALARIDAIVRRYVEENP